jgi:hypothetical protein
LRQANEKRLLGRWSSEAIQESGTFDRRIENTRTAKARKVATPYPPLQKPFTVIPHAGEANVESNSHN